MAEVHLPGVAHTGLQDHASLGQYEDRVLALVPGVLAVEGSAGGDLAEASDLGEAHGLLQPEFFEVRTLVEEAGEFGTGLDYELPEGFLGGPGQVLERQAGQHGVVRGFVSLPAPLGVDRERATRQHQFDARDGANGEGGGGRDAGPVNAQVARVPG